MIVVYIMKKQKLLILSKRVEKLNYKIMLNIIGLYDFENKFKGKRMPIGNLQITIKLALI